MNNIYCYSQTDYFVVSQLFSALSWDKKQNKNRPTLRLCDNNTTAFRNPNKSERI